MNPLEAIRLDLADYFGSAKGQGILATSDFEGRVDAAVYAKPKIIDEETIAFIMRDRLTHTNVGSNPYAAYLFLEDGSGGYEGIRLFLTKIHEEEDTEQLYALRRKDHNEIKESKEERGRLFLVFFRVDKVLPLTTRSRHVAKAA